VNYLNAEADLRDIPHGTFFLFFLTRTTRQLHPAGHDAGPVQMDAGHRFSYRSTEVKLADGKLFRDEAKPAEK